MTIRVLFLRFLLEISKIRITKNGSKNGEYVAYYGHAMVYNSGKVFVKFQDIAHKDWEDSFVELRVIYF